MKKIFILSVILTVCNLFANASNIDAKYCLTYEDFVADRWTPIDSLTNGNTKQLCQIKFEDNQYKVKTGDRKADAFLRKEALAVQYGGHLYVNCRNLRCDDARLNVTNFAQAYRYDGDKLCVVAHWYNKGLLFAGIVAESIAFSSTSIPVEVSSIAASEAVWLTYNKWNNFRCYILENGADEKGKSAVTRITDEQMEVTLSDTPELLERYKALDKKGARQSASNIVPFLQEKGLVKDI